MPASRPLADRFWEKVQKTESCWLWIAGKDSRGYENITDANGCDRKAHRVGYEMLVGPIPEGFDLDHLCRNHSCVNPAHLEAVTHKENCDRGIRGDFNDRCPQGHVYDRRYIGTRNFRWCKTCHRAASRKHKAKLRGILCSSNSVARDPLAPNSN